mmetsp:Transcript_5873/g.18001  ORF Transcript_5873/g.18001 Transcript_5873/m.18001 type:complete len:238 (+) Transcript_5873:2970-3683(+)
MVLSSRAPRASSTRTTRRWPSCCTSRSAWVTARLRATRRTRPTCSTLLRRRLRCCVTAWSSSRTRARSASMRWSPRPILWRASAPAACRWARSRARRTRRSQSRSTASAASPTLARAARTRSAGASSATSTATASRALWLISRALRTATLPHPRSSRSLRAALACRRSSWSTRTSLRSRWRRAPSPGRVASCLGPRSRHTSRRCAVPSRACRSSRLRRTTISTRSRTSRSSSTTCTR